MSIDTLRHNIGRLCMDGNGTLYMIADVEYLPWSAPKYLIYHIAKGETFYLHSSTFNNGNLVTWLTPPRQNPVAQPPQRQNDDASE